MVASPYLVVFFIVILACVVCIGYGIFRLVRYILNERAVGRDNELEFAQLRAQLAADNPGRNAQQIEVNAERASGIVADVGGLLETPGAQQALALLKVGGLLATDAPLWVSLHGDVYVFTKRPQQVPTAIAPPAWLAALPNERIEVVPAGASVEVAVMKLNASAHNAVKPYHDDTLLPNSTVDATDD